IYTQLALQNQSLVQSSELTTLLQTPVSHLLQSKKKADIDLGLDAAGRFNVQDIRESIVAQINEKTPDETLTLALKVLENDPTANQEVFTQTFQNKYFGFERRAMALHSLVKANTILGEQAVKEWIV